MAVPLGTAPTANPPSWLASCWRVAASFWRAVTSAAMVGPHDPMSATAFCTLDRALPLWVAMAPIAWAWVSSPGAVVAVVVELVVEDPPGDARRAVGWVTGGVPGGFEVLDPAFERCSAPEASSPTPAANKATSTHAVTTNPRPALFGRTMTVGWTGLSGAGRRPRRGATCGPGPSGCGATGTTEVASSGGPRRTAVTGTEAVGVPSGPPAPSAAPHRRQKRSPGRASSLQSAQATTVAQGTGRRGRFRTGGADRSAPGPPLGPRRARLRPPRSPVGRRIRSCDRMRCERTPRRRRVVVARTPGELAATSVVGDTAVRDIGGVDDERSGTGTVAGHPWGAGRRA